MTLGSFKGAHIALHKGVGPRVTLRDVAAGTSVKIPEGIEDGLTVAMADPASRYLAAATLDNIGALDLPPAVTEVTLIEQNDDDYRVLCAAAARLVGDEARALHHEKAARDIERSKERNIKTHQEAGRTVNRAWPAPGFKDFNDQLRGVRMEGAA